MKFSNNLKSNQLDIFPISVFYVESRDTLIRNSILRYAPSSYYKTEKMRCMYSYKPSILI